MTELAILIQPAAFLVTQGDGTHELTRCYYQDGKYSVGSYSNARVGKFTVVGAALEADGLRMSFGAQDGLQYEVFVPMARVQSTHRV